MRSGGVQFHCWGPGSELAPRTLQLGKCLEFDWFKPRRYRHFDRPVNVEFAKKAMNAAFVERHSFTPLIKYTKKIRRYKSDLGKTVIKNRPIMYASHRDACILSLYSQRLNALLDDFYKDNNLNDAVIAYRSLGKGNYDFSAAALRYAISHSPCVVLAFDVSEFFDTLDHGLLKSRLKRLLGSKSIPEDWYSIYRFMTDFHYVEMEEMKKNPVLSTRLKGAHYEPIATIAEVKESGIKIYSNSKKSAGIPQGTPISAAMSNLYMMDFDIEVNKYCAERGAMYLRYSDDILIICPVEDGDNANDKVEALLDAEKLKISKAKTERTIFDPGGASTGRSAQYLGFSYYPGGAGIRPGSLSRQWRKMRKSIRRTEAAAKKSLSSGKANKVYTKKLRRRFSPIKVRNFSSYARRSAVAFGDGEKITSQVKRFEREFERKLRALLKKLHSIS